MSTRAGTRTARLYATLARYRARWRAGEFLRLNSEQFCELLARELAAEHPPEAAAIIAALSWEHLRMFDGGEA